MSVNRQENGVGILGGDIQTNPDTRLLGRTSIIFDAADNLTTEKLSDAISLVGLRIAPDNGMRLHVSKPTEDIALDMTIKIYEESKVDGVNKVYCTVVESLTVEMVAGVATNRVFDIAGLGYGEGQIKIGASFAVDSGAITPVFALFRK